MHVMKKTKRWTSVPSDNQTIWGIEQEYGVENLGLSTDVKEKKKKRKKKKSFELQKLPI